MYNLLIKFISRNPKKSMGYIRDIAIPIILLLSVGAIFLSFNTQLSSLFSQVPPSNSLLIRDIGSPIEQSIIPVSIEEELLSLGYDPVLPLRYENIDFTFFKDNQNITMNFPVIFCNISQLSYFNIIKTIQTPQLFNISSNEFIIGSVLEKKLKIEQISGPFIIKSSYNSSINLSLKYTLHEPDPYQNYIIMNFDLAPQLISGFNSSYYSEIMVKVASNDDLMSIASSLELSFSKNYPECKCDILAGTGSASLISIVIGKLIQNLDVFFTILKFLIIIRIFQALLWVGNDFKYELNVLKILGTTRLKILFLFIFLGLVFGNIALLLSFIGIIIIPALISLILSIFTLSSSSLSVPNEIQLVESIFVLNVIFILSSIVPGGKIALVKIVNPKTRD